MKPMLAATIEDIGVLKFPLYASPKLDGIRALVMNGNLYSRNLKLIPNGSVQNGLPLVRMGGFDGELIVGNPWDKDVFRNTSSGIMSGDGFPDFTYWVFDRVMDVALPYRERLVGLKQQVTQTLKGCRVKMVPQIIVSDAFQIYDYEQKMLDKGFEGIMLRSLDGAYKFGRSTLNEGHLMKLKRFSDSEAKILGFVSQKHNTNEAKRNKLGQIERSSHKAGMVDKATLGSLVVQDLVTGVRFDIGTGFDDKLRKEIWEDRKYFANKIVKYKYFPTGSKEKPRFPVFLGFRDLADMSK